MAIGQAWWATLHECQGLLQRGDVVASRARLKSLVRCVQAAAEPEALSLLDEADRVELQKVTRTLRVMWRRTQLCWQMRN